MTKPPFVPLTMADVNDAPSNGLTAVSTFTGAGGSCLGLRLAGWTIPWGCEFIPAARDTYLANYPDVVLDPRDIREVTGADIREASGVGDGDIDLLEGSPPCAAFSTSGVRSRKWGEVANYSDTRQRVDDLFFEFIRLIGELKPRAFLAENVSGLVKGVARGYFQQIHQAMAAEGYRIEARLLDAQWLGVPQRRKRLWLQGIRDDVTDSSGQPVYPAWPEPLPYFFSLRDAIAPLTEHLADPHAGARFSRDRPKRRTSGSYMWTRPDISDEPCSTVLSSDSNALIVMNDQIAVDPETGYDLRNTVRESGPRLIHDNSGAVRNRQIATDDPAPTITSGEGGLNARHYQVLDDGVTVDPETGENVSLLPHWAISKVAGMLPEGKPAGSVNEAVYRNLTRSHRDLPSPTVTYTAGKTAAAGVLHPTGRRKFTLVELRLVMGYPVDFILTGSYAQRWERLARSVPPPMSAAIGREMADALRA